MADSTDTKTVEDSNSSRRDRKFSVSSNRGRASHKLRYVEAGGAAVDIEDCTFCQSMPELSDGDDGDSGGGDKEPGKSGS